MFDIEFVKDFIRRVDKRVNAVTLTEVLLISSMYLIMKSADPKWFVENGFVENLQLIILAVAFMVCMTARSEKKFFVFCGLVVLFLIMRETNLGRSFFCEKYLKPNEICRWNNLPYGYMADVVRILYVILILVYAIYNKLWLPLWRYISKAPIYVWDIGIMVLCAFLGIMAETRYVDNEILEETAETIMYISLTYCLWRYSRYQFKV